MQVHVVFAVTYTRARPYNWAVFRRKCIWYAMSAREFLWLPWNTVCQILCRLWWVTWTDCSALGPVGVYPRGFGRVISHIFWCGGLTRLVISTNLLCSDRQIVAWKVKCALLWGGGLDAPVSSLPSHCFGWQCRLFTKYFGQFSYIFICSVYTGIRLSNASIMFGEWDYPVEITISIIDTLMAADYYINSFIASHHLYVCGLFVWSATDNFIIPFFSPEVTPHWGGVSWKKCFSDNSLWLCPLTS